MDVKVNFKGGGSLVEQRPQFMANSEHVCTAWKNKILCYSTKTGKLVCDFKGIASKIVGFSVHKYDSFDSVTACSEAGEIITWKVSTHFKMLNKKIGRKGIRTFHLISSDSADKMEALISFREGNTIGFCLYNLGTDTYQNYKLTLNSGEPFFVDVCGNKYFSVVQSNRISHIKMYSFLKIFHHIIEKSRTFTCVACHPEEEIVLTGDSSGRVVAWQNLFNIKQTQAVYHWHTLPVKCLSFSESGSFFYSGGDESVLVRWQLENNLQKKFLPRLPANIEQISVSSGNLYIAVATRDNAIRIIDSKLDKVSLIQHLVIGNQFNSGILVDPQTKALIMNGNVGHIQFFSPSDANLLFNVDVVGQNKISNERSCKMENTQVTKVAISKSGLWMATVEERKDIEFYSGNEIRLKFWNFDLKNQTFSLNTSVEFPHEKSVTSILFQPNSNENELKCATVGDDEKFKIWQLMDASTVYSKNNVWKCQSTGFYGGLFCKGLAYSVDGSLLAVGFDDILTIWLSDFCEIKCSLVHPNYKEPIKVIHFGTKRQSHLVVAGSDSRINVWNILTLSMIWTVPTTISLLISDPISSYMALLTLDRKVFVFCPSSPTPIFQSDKLLRSYGEIQAATFLPTRYCNDSRLKWYQRSSLHFITVKKELFNISAEEEEITGNFSYETENSYFKMIQPQTKTSRVKSVDTHHLPIKSISGIKEYLSVPIHTMKPIRLVCGPLLQSMLLKN